MHSRRVSLYHTVMETCPFELDNQSDVQAVASEFVALLFSALNYSENFVLTPYINY